MDSPAVVIAAIGALGIGAQWIAWRTGWPAIVLMLAAGFLARPVLGLFDPEETFGSLLEPMIGIGVALTMGRIGQAFSAWPLRLWALLLVWTLIRTVPYVAIEGIDAPLPTESPAWDVP